MAENATKIVEILRGIWGIHETAPGSEIFEGEVYADYRDELDEKSAGEILQSDDPDTAFIEKMDEWYGSAAWQELCDVADQVSKKLTEDGIEMDEDELRYLVGNYVYFKYPEDHFLNQEICINLMLDTGDGNVDYTLNSAYPCWYGRAEDRLDDRASIVWLARQQGYTKTQLWKALEEGDIADPNGFLQSMRQELANLPSYMATLTFLVKMSFRQALILNRAIKWRDKQGKFYDARKAPQCGYIELDKNVTCGLYNPWSGGGSVLEIQLDKDVGIPIKYIRCALPDEGGYAHEYSIGNVYGLCRDAWTNTVKKLSVHPKISL